jgi:hypothetical protein
MHNHIDTPGVARKDHRSRALDPRRDEALTRMPPGSGPEGGNRRATDRAILPPPYSLSIYRMPRLRRYSPTSESAALPGAAPAGLRPGRTWPDGGVR